MKLLLYGFGPYLSHKDNVTMHVLKKLKVEKNIICKKVIFDVKYDKKMFLSEIKKFNPDVIIGLGQCARGKKIRIERRAVNIKGTKQKVKSIYKNKPRFIFASIKLKMNKISRLVYNKSDGYVCNYSMYAILDYCSGLEIKYAFIHIPKKFDVASATKFLNQKINELK
ncbi:MAG: hypothetical protein ACP5N2_00580 [Candidatus Nanoarchaeia archaeon]